MKLNEQIFDLLQLFIAEVLATAFLLYFGCMGIIPGLDQSSNDVNSLQVAFVWGFINTVCIVIFGCISGAYMNPAITLCAIIFKRVSLLVGLMYIVAQCIGASLGIWLVKLTASNAKYPENFCSVKIHPSVSFSEAFLSEFMGTSVLIYAACSTWDPRNSQYQDSMPIKFGFVMATINFALGNYSACVNPARGFGPALINGFWNYQWFYWLVPLSASAFTTVFYKFIFLKKYREFSNQKLAPGTQDSITL